ncbi:hypothetical protein [Ruania alba]|uniref:Uncharacterized protein n=1 Tax=Ruania alba TaxID=648782 RepID=A0A1H5EXY0_9MICO|nr:hypothetical protein [Ruania alba]SED95874.1 hypothetical protein SAMN04488554_1163 [Ruania alba]
MSQYQPPQGQPPVPGAAPPGDAYGQPAQQGGYGHPAQPGGAYGQQPPPGDYAQQPSAYGQPGTHAAGAPAQPGAPMSYPAGPQGPGLFDTTFTTSTIAKTAKPAFVAVIVLSGALALAGLFSAIAQFAQLRFGGAVSALGGLIDLVLYGGLAFAVLVLGRLLVDHVVQSAKEREAVAAARAAAEQES